MLMKKINQINEHLNTKLKFFAIIYIVGFLLYSFLINNQLVNTYDGLWQGQYNIAGKWETSIGRVLLPLFDFLHWGINGEPLQSLFALVFLCLSLVLIFELFDAINLKGIFLSLFIIGHTTTLNLFSYRYTSLDFFIGIFIATLAAFIYIREPLKSEHLKNLVFQSANFGDSNGNHNSKKSKIRLFIGSHKQVKYYLFIEPILIIATLSIYQTFISVTLFILISYYIYSILHKKDIFIKDIIIFLILFLLSCIVYKIAWSVELKIFNIGISSYGNADKTNVLNMILNLPTAFINSYVLLFRYLSGDGIIIHNAFKLYIIEILFTIIVIINIFVNAYKIKLQKEKLFLLILLTLLIPPALCAQLFFAVGNGVNTVSSFPYVLFIPMLFLLYFNYNKNYINIITLLLSVIILHSTIYQFEVDMTTMWESKNATVNLMNSVINKLEIMNLYNDEYEYMFLGKPAENEMFFTTENKHRILKEMLRANSYARVGDFWTSPGNMWMSYNGLFKNVMGCGIKINLKTYEDYAYIKDIEQYLSLEPFPKDNFAMQVDNVVIVKISN